MKWIDTLIIAMMILFTSAAIFQDAKEWLIFLGALAGSLVIIEEVVSQRFEVEQRRNVPAKDHFDGVYHKNSKDLGC